MALSRFHRYSGGLRCEMKLRRLLLAALIIASAGMSWKFMAVTTVAHAQQAQSQNPVPPPADTSTPVFKAETRLVLVDTIVTDKKGNYVTDLTAKDFKVWEDNKEQPIKSFSLESTPLRRLKVTGTTWCCCLTTPP